MPDLTNEQTRELVQRVVLAETANQLAPLREMVQIVRGETTQLGRELAALRKEHDDLADSVSLIVDGNERLNLAGVPKQITNLRTAVTAEITQVDKKVDAIGADVKGLKADYASFISTVKGARLAVYLLAAALGWWPLQAIAKLTGLLP